MADRSDRQPPGRWPGRLEALRDQMADAYGSPGARRLCGDQASVRLLGRIDGARRGARLNRNVERRRVQMVALRSVASASDAVGDAILKSDGPDRVPSRIAGAGARHPRPDRERRRLGGTVDAPGGRLDAPRRLAGAGSHYLAARSLQAFRSRSDPDEVRRIPEGDDFPSLANSCQAGDAALMVPDAVARAGATANSRCRSSSSPAKRIPASTKKTMVHRSRNHSHRLPQKRPCREWFFVQ